MVFIKRKWKILAILLVVIGYACFYSLVIKTSVPPLLVGLAKDDQGVVMFLLLLLPFYFFGVVLLSFIFKATKKDLTILPKGQHWHRYGKKRKYK